MPQVPQCVLTTPIHTFAWGRKPSLNFHAHVRRERPRPHFSPSSPSLRNKPHHFFRAHPCSGQALQRGLVPALTQAAPGAGVGYSTRASYCHVGRPVLKENKTQTNFSGHCRVPLKEGRPRGWGYGWEEPVRARRTALVTQAAGGISCSGGRTSREVSDS